MSGDLISRQAVLDGIDVKAWEFCDYLISKGRNDEQKPVSHFADNLREYIRDELPPVTPQEPKTDEENIHREREQAYMQGYEDACKKYRQEPKTGHWEPFDLTYGRDIYKCSVCKCATNVPTVLGIPMFKYCPSCGARMVEP